MFLDTRKKENQQLTRISINLALSTRGIEALKEVGLAETVLQRAIPMRARMIHELDGACWSYAYGTKGQVLARTQYSTRFVI